MALFSNWFKSKDGAVPAGPQGPDAEEPAAEATPAVAQPTVAAVRTVKPHTLQPVRTSGPKARAPISLMSASPGGGSHMTPPSRMPSYGTPEMEMEPAPEYVAASEPPPGPSEPDAIVHLELGDFVDRIPVNFLQPGEVDRHQQIQFYVSELYSDLSKGRATVPASIIYQKCPEIFARPVSDTEDVEVHLPLHRLVEQMSSALAPRHDQTPEESVAEIETPFLQVAMEDNARLPKAAGTSMGATVRAIGLPGARKSTMPGIPQPTVQAEPGRRTKAISPISPIKHSVETKSIAAPTNQSAGPINASKRPPSTVRASVAGGKIRLSAPAIGSPKPSAVTPTVPRPSEAPPKAADEQTAPRVYMPASPRVPSVSPSHQVTKKTARIQIPPISLRPASAASPRPPTTPEPPAPPASRGNESLTSFKPVGKSGPPAMTPPTFRSTPPPPSYVKPQPPATPPSFSPARTAPPAGDGPDSGLMAQVSASLPSLAPASPPTAKDQLIELSLSGVLRGIPSTALIVEPTSIPESARVSLPFALIEPQLANGRVSVPIDTFRAALPSAFNHVLADDCDLAEVPIPLQEVFMNLPSNVITQRHDQIIEEARNSFPTPFSQKAEEDAKRFAASAAAAAQIEPEVAPAIEEATEPEAEAVEDPVVAELPAIIEEPPAIVEDEEPEPFADKAEVSESFSDPVDSFPVTEPPVLEEKTPVFEEEAPAALPDPESPAEKAHAPADFHQADGPLKEAGDILEKIEAPESAPISVALPALAPVAEKKLPAPARLNDSALQSLFMTEDDLDAKAVAKLVSQLPGVDSCSVMFDDGLLLAGSQPQDGQTEGFSAMAPPLFQRVRNFTNELSLGDLQACTLHTDTGLLSLFSHANICLAVRHSGRGFMPGVREKLLVVTRELAGMYGPAATEAAPRD